MNKNIKLITRRLELYRTAWSICRKTGIHPTMYSQFENGQRVPSQKVKRRIAKELNCEPEALWPEGGGGPE